MSFEATTRNVVYYVEGCMASLGAVLNRQYCSHLQMYYFAAI